MKAGDVFVWNNFPFIRDKSSELKRRWFVFLGRCPVFNMSIIAYLVTATTKNEYYKPGASRHKNIFCEFPKGCGGLEEDSIVDLDINFYRDIEMETLEKYALSIEIKGRLPDDRIRQLYNKILECKRIPLIMKIDIHESFVRDGVSGLRTPKRR